MANGVNIVTTWFKSIGGASYLTGSNNDDYINIKNNMETGRFSSTEINLFNGDDGVWIGGLMTGYGKNTISGGSGNKNISINQGMYGNNGAENIINLGGEAGNRHNITIGFTQSANGGQNKITTLDGTDNLTFTSLFHAYQYGINSIDLGNGTKSIVFSYDFIAYNGGANVVNLGIGSHNLDIGTNFTANYLGQNNITSVSGDTILNIKNTMYADGNNSINLGFGNHNITIGNIFAAGNGYNSIHTEGTTNLTVNRDVISYHTNEIITGAGNDTITINWGINAVTGDNIIDTGGGNDTVNINGYMNAAYGDNFINTGAGNDTINIKGNITGSYYNTNYLNTGDGNDNIKLNGSVGIKGLSIDAGAGYDTLTLIANDYVQFDWRYKGWITNIAKTNSLGATDLEAINVEIGRSHSLKQIDWLTNIINDYNTNNEDSQIHMGVNLDNWSGAFRLGDVFTSANEQAIDTINLTGSKANILSITKSLASNGYDNNTLHINGDTNDIVSFDRLWSKTGSNIVDQNTGVAYNIYHNSNNEDVYVQNGVNVIYT